MSLSRSPSPSLLPCSSLFHLFPVFPFLIPFCHLFCKSSHPSPPSSSFVLLFLITPLAPTSTHRASPTSTDLPADLPTPSFSISPLSSSLFPPLPLFGGFPPIFSVPDTTVDRPGLDLSLTSPKQCSVSRTSLSGPGIQTRTLVCCCITTPLQTSLPSEMIPGC